MILTNEEIKIITKVLCEHKADTEMKLRKALEKRQKDETTLMFIDICKTQIRECKQALETKYESLRYIPKDEIKSFKIIYKTIFTKLITEEYRVLNYNCTSENSETLSKNEKRSCLRILKQLETLIFRGEENE